MTRTGILRLLVAARALNACESSKGQIVIDGSLPADAGDEPCFVEAVEAEVALDVSFEPQWAAGNGGMEK